MQLSTKTRVLFLGALLSVVATATPSAAAPEPIRVFISETTHCFMTVSNGGVVALGQSFSFQNSDADAHRINQRQGFWNVRVPGDRNVNHKMRAAGRFAQRCDSESYDDDDIAIVPMRAQRVSGVTFKLRWALDDAPSRWRYTVRYRIGSGSYVKFRSGTAARSASFVADDGKTYRFQAKAIRFGKSSGWSPVRTFTA